MLKSLRGPADKGTLKAFASVSRQTLAIRDQAGQNRVTIIGDAECRRWLEIQPLKSAGEVVTFDRAKEMEDAKTFALKRRDLVTQLTVKDVKGFDLLCKVLMQLPGVEQITLKNCDMLDAQWIDANAICEYVTARVGNTGDVSRPDETL